MIFDIRNLENYPNLKMKEINCKKVIIFGSSGHAKVAIDIFEKTENIKIIGLLDSFKTINENTFDYQILGSEKALPNLLKTDPNIKIFIAIGDNWLRFQIMKKVLDISPGIEFISAIHPSAIIGKNVIIGKGVVVMPGVIINSDSVIEDFCIINTKSSVGHECQVGKFASLASNVTLGGNVKIGNYSAISISATILNNKNVGSHSVIGAGAIVTKDCLDKAVYYGVPAKKIRMREIGDLYLKNKAI